MIPVVFVGGFGLGATLAIVAAVVYGQQAAPTTDVLADVTERLQIGRAHV